MIAKRKILLAGMFSLLWMLVLFIAYASTHKPFTPENLTAILLAAWRLVVAGGLLSLAGGAGERFIPAKFSGWTRAALSAALGMGIVSLVTLIIGSTLGFNLILWILLLIGAGILLKKEIRSWWMNWQSEPLALTTGYEKIIGGLCLLLAIISLVIALAPPLQFDALTYHLALPRFYLLEGRLAYTPDIMFWGMPQLAEMQYTLAMMFGGAQTATVLGAGIGFIALAGMLGYVRKRFSSKASWTVMAVFLAGETLSSSLAWGYNEWVSILYGFAVLVFMDDWLANGERKEILLAGIFGGLALSTKYTSGLILVMGISAILLRGKQSLRKKILDCLIFGSIATLVVAPWLIKNLAATGNPFYPILFPAGAMDSERVFFYHSVSVKYDWRSVIFLPLQATILGVDGKQGFSASIGVLFFSFSTLSWIGWHRRTAEQKRLILTGLVFSLTGFIVWAIASQQGGLLIQTRLYVVLFPAWGILAAAGMDGIVGLSAARIRFGRIASMLVVLALGLNAFSTILTLQSQQATDTVLGIKNEAAYLERNMSDFSKAMLAINNLPDNARVLLLYETRSYYCLPKCDPDEVLDRWYDDIRIHNGNLDSVIQAWKDDGYTHVLIFDFGADFIKNDDPRYPENDWITLTELPNHLQLLESGSQTYSLYKLQP